MEYGLRAKPRAVFEFLERIVNLNIENAKRDRPKHVPCLWGSHGIGKTDLCFQLKEEGVISQLAVIPLAQIEETGDIHGLPLRTEDETGRPITVMAPPKWVPTSEEVGVVCIDDFNRADPRIIRAIMQLLQFYETISWKLPKNTTIVLTANPEEGPYTVTTLDPAMLTRMAHITMVTDKVQWLEWAQRHDIDSRVMSFIAQYPEWLCPSSANARSCPRAWADFSNAIQEIPTESLQEESTLFLYGKAFLDDEPLAPFTMFLSGDLAKIVEPEKIVDDYSSVRGDVLSPIREGRHDIVAAIADRFVAYVNSLKKVEENSQRHRNILTFLEEDELFKDLKMAIVRELRFGPVGGKLLSAKLSRQLGQVSPK